MDAESIAASWQGEDFLGETLSGLNNARRCDEQVDRCFAPDVLAKRVTLKIRPLRKDFDVVMEPSKMPAFDANGTALELRGVEPVVEYELPMQAGQ